MSSLVLNFMRIFGIGLPKTGTTSLSKAINLLGIKSNHDCEKHKQLCGLLPQNVFPDGEAYFDGPICREWNRLFLLYPDAKFILSTRDREEWINSLIVHALHNRVFNTGWPHISTQTQLTKWDDHHEQVRRMLGDSRNFLEINVCGGEGWEKLCPFLGYDIPSFPFPHQNLGREKLERILEKWKLLR